jgi:type IV secretion system protein VirD4
MAAPFEPSPFKFGYYYYEETDTADKTRELAYRGVLPILLFGVMGSGKFTRILAENLATLKNRSLVVIDLKGELAATTHRIRRTLGDVKIIDPYGVLKKIGVELESDGYNSLALLKPGDDEFFDNAKLLTLAIIEVEGESQKFWPESAQGWFCIGIMMEVITAKREGRPPSLLNARRWCLQPDEWEEVPPIKKGKTEVPQEPRLVKGARLNAQKAMAEGGQLADLAAGFADQGANQKEMKSIVGTLRTQTEFLVSNPIARDVEKGNWSFAQLKEKPTTVYIVVPPKQLQDKRRWLRMLVTSALCDHDLPGPFKTLFILDEFRASIGNLQIVNDFWSLVRGFGVQFMPICQSATQLKKLFGEEWENYAAQAGAVATIGSVGDLTTAKWLSERAGTVTEFRKSRNEGESVNVQGIGSSTGESISEAEKAFKTANELMSLPVGTGMIWTPGEGTKSIPFYARPYFKCPDINPLVDPNPYAPDAATSSPRASSAGKSSTRDWTKTYPAVKAVYAVIVAYAVAVWWNYGGEKPAVPAAPKPAASSPAPQYKSGDRDMMNRLIQNR